MYSDSRFVNVATDIFFGVEYLFTAAANTKHKGLHPVAVRHRHVLTLAPLGEALMLAAHFANLQSQKLFGPFRGGV